MNTNTRELTLDCRILWEYCSCLTEKQLGRALYALCAFMLHEPCERKMTAAEQVMTLHFKNEMLEQADKSRVMGDKNRVNARKRYAKEPLSDADTCDLLPNAAKACDSLPNAAKACDSLPNAATESGEYEEENNNIIINNLISSSEKEKEESTSPFTQKASGSAGQATAREEKASREAEEKRAAFKRFRKEYPKKAGMAKAEPLFYRALECVSEEELFSVLKQHKYMDDWQRDRGRYIPLAEKWLKERCWEDVPARYDDGYETFDFSEFEDSEPKSN